MNKKEKAKSIGTKVYPMIALLGIFTILIIFLNKSALSVIAGNTDKEGIFLEALEDQRVVTENVLMVQLYAAQANKTTDADTLSAIISKLDASVEAATAAKESFTTHLEESKDDTLISSGKAVTDVVDAYLAESKVLSESLAKLDTTSAFVSSSKLVAYTSKIGETSSSFANTFQEAVADIKNKTDLRVRGTLIFNNILVVLVVGIIAFIIAFLRKKVIQPARNAKSEVLDIVKAIEDGNGDLTKRIEIKEKDEIGQLISAINDFMSALQSIITSIKIESSNMNESVSMVKGSVASANESAGNISATMEEMSASIEEVTATISTIATGSENILSDVTKMSDHIQSGIALVRDINDRAGEMKDNTINQQTLVRETVQKLDEELTAAVKESNKADKISLLTDDILSIASQTNLLALNASIEAARAGEAGRGFAVVADEIRQLADSSKTAANNIQEISSDVVKAVHKLASDSSEMLEFLRTEIIKDFDDFADVVDQYKSDADSMNDIIQGINENVHEVNETVATMTANMSEMSIAMDENALGVTTVAESAVELVGAMTTIHNQAIENDDISRRLEDNVSMFQKI